jgi:cell division protein FtsI (penicillin-binding protein 3)
MSSFVGAFPMNAPRCVIFAMLDEPSGTKETRGYATGGWVAAPIVSRVISRIGPMLGMRPVDEEAPAIRRKMAIDVVTKKTGKRRLASF